MFAEHTNEVNDLEWMLLSGQVDRSVLANELVEQYWGQIAQFCNSVLGPSVAASQSAEATFRTALLDIYQYRSGLGVRTWLFLLAIESCQKNRPGAKKGRQKPTHDPKQAAGQEARSRLGQIALEVLDQLSWHDRQAVALVLVSNWQIEQAARLVGSGPDAVRAALFRYHSLFLQRAEDIVRLPEPGQADIDLQLAGWLYTEFPQISLTDEQAHVQAAKLVRLAERREPRRILRNRLAEGILVTSVALAIAGLIWAMRLSFPDDKNAKGDAYQTVLTTRLVQGAPEVGYLIITATPAIKMSPTPFPEDWFYIVEPGDTYSSISGKFGDFSAEDLILLNRLLPEEKLIAGKKLLLPSRTVIDAASIATPVAYQEEVDNETIGRQAISSNVPEVYQRLQWLGSGWQTLWIDLLAIDYGPEGYNNGPGKLERTQAWLSGNQLLIIQGGSLDVPEQAWLALFDQNKYYFSHPAAGTPWFIETSLSELFSSRPVSTSLLALFNPFRADTSQSGRRFEIQDIEQLGSRQARLINQYDPEGNLTRQLWVDLQSGLVLQMLKYSASGKIVQHLLVNHLDVDIDLPQALMNQAVPWRGGFAGDFTGDAEQASETLLP